MLVFMLFHKCLNFLITYNFYLQRHVTFHVLLYNPFFGKMQSLSLLRKLTFYWYRFLKFLFRFDSVEHISSPQNNTFIETEDFKYI